MVNIHPHKLTFVCSLVLLGLNAGAQPYLAPSAKVPPPPKSQTQSTHTQEHLAEEKTKSTPSPIAPNAATDAQNSPSPVSATTTATGFATEDQKEWQTIIRNKSDAASKCPSASASLENKAPASTEYKELLEQFKQWPGIPQETIRAYRFVLRTKNPPTEFNGEQFLEEINSFPTCNLNEQIQIARHLTERLKDASLAREDKLEIAKASRAFLEKINLDQLDLRKSQSSIELMVRLLESRLDEKLNRKERQIRSLATKYSGPPREPASPFSQNFRDFWQSVHFGESARMEIARVLYFP